MSRSDINQVLDQKILRLLNGEGDGAPTISEAARYIHEQDAPVRRRVRALTEVGYIEKLGTAQSGAQCYGITAAGRATINA